MEYLRDVVTESAANTFTENEIQTPVAGLGAIVTTGKGGKRPAMLIHEIIYTQASLDVPVDADAVSQQWTSASKAGLVGPENSDYIDSQIDDVILITSGLVVRRRRLVRKFDPPILYAKSSIFHGAVSAGQAAAAGHASAIGYTITNVDNATFIAALVD